MIFPIIACQAILLNTTLVLSGLLLNKLITSSIRGRIRSFSLPFAWLDFSPAQNNSILFCLFHLGLPSSAIDRLTFCLHHPHPDSMAQQDNGFCQRQRHTKCPKMRLKFGNRTGLLHFHYEVVSSKSSLMFQVPRQWLRDVMKKV